MTDEIKQQETLLTFPCDFTFKIFGLANDEFQIAVLSIIRKHAPDFSDQLINSRPSKEGKYNALSITIHAQSKEQIDNIYRELSSSPQVMMVL